MPKLSLPSREMTKGVPLIWADLGLIVAAVLGSVKVPPLMEALCIDDGSLVMLPPHVIVCCD